MGCGTAGGGWCSHHTVLILRLFNIAVCLVVLKLPANVMQTAYKLQSGIWWAAPRDPDRPFLKKHAVKMGSKHADAGDTQVHEQAETNMATPKTSGYHGVKRPSGPSFVCTHMWLSAMDEKVHTWKEISRTSGRPGYRKFPASPPTIYA